MKNGMALGVAAVAVVAVILFAVSRENNEGPLEDAAEEIGEAVDDAADEIDDAVD